MSKFDHDILLKACWSNQATEEERQKLSYAAGMYAAGEHKITRAEVRMAESILARDGGQDEYAEYTTEPADASKYGEGFTILKVTSGQNAGRLFLVKETAEGVVRGQRVFKSMAAAAGGWARAN